MLTAEGAGNLLKPEQLRCWSDRARQVPNMRHAQKLLWTREGRQHENLLTDAPPNEEDADDGPNESEDESSVMADFGPTDFGQPFWSTEFGQTDFGQRWCFSGMADFGQNRLWPNRLWPNRLWPALLGDRVWPNRFRLVLCVSAVWPTLAKTDFGQTDLGQAEFDLWCCVVLCCVCVFVGLVSRFHGVGFHVWVLVSRFWSCSVPPDRPSRDRPSQDRNRPSREPPFPRTALPAGASHDNQRTPNVHIRAPGPSETPPKFHEKTPKREEKKENCGGRGKEKREILAPHPSASGPHLWAPTLRAPTFSGLGPTLRTPTSWVHEAPPFSTHPPTTTQHTQKKLNNQFQQTQTINSQKSKSLHTTET